MTRAATGDAVATRSQQRECNGGSEEHALQFQGPSALVVELAELAHVHQRDRGQHVDGDQRSAEACVEAGDQHQRCQHLTDEYGVAEEAGQPLRFDHADDAGGSALQLGDAVQQDQHAERQAQDQLSKIILGVLVHCVPLWLWPRWRIVQGRALCMRS